MAVAQRQEYLSVWSLPPCTALVSVTALECLQKAHVLDPFPGLNPTSDCFILREDWNSPYSKGLNYKLAKTWLRMTNTFVFCCPLSLLGHLCSFFVSYSPLPYHLWTRATVPSPSSLSAQTSCSFKNLGHPVSLWATLSSSDVFLSTYPAWCRPGAYPPSYTLTGFSP